MHLRLGPRRAKRYRPIASLSELSPEDLDAVQLVAWSDAGCAGDPEDSESTSGFLLELINPNDGRRWVICWAVRSQGSTSSSTAEAEI